MRYVNPSPTISNVVCNQLSIVLLVGVMLGTLTACSTSSSNPLPTIGIDVGPGVNFRGDIVALQFLPNQQLLVGVGYDGVYRWKLATSTIEQTLAAKQIYLAFTASGPLVVSTDRKTLTTWNSTECQTIATA